MEFRRSQRRRRVLIEETVVAPQEPGSEPARLSRSLRRADKSAPARRYSEAALRERQPCWIALLPLRRYVQAVILLSILTVLAGLVAAYGYVDRTFTGPVRSDWAALDLEQRGNAANWLASMVLAAAAATSAAIYCLRRHKVDDYRGRYRLWLWMAAALSLASFDATAGLHRAAGATLQQLAGGWFSGGALLWGLLLYAAVVSALGVRLAIEMWSARGALLLLLGAVLLYAVAAAALQQWLWSGGESFTAIAITTLSMLAHTLLFASLLMFLRHVYLDAQGLLVLKVALKPARRAARHGSATTDGSSADKPAEKPSQSRSSLASAAPAARVSKPAMPSQSAAGASGTTPRRDKTANQSPPLRVVENVEETDQQGLSRAERRRLRKLQRRAA